MSEDMNEIALKKAEVLALLEDKGFSVEDVEQAEKLLDKTYNAFVNDDEESAKKYTAELMAIVVSALF